MSTAFPANVRRNRATTGATTKDALARACSPRIAATIWKGQGSTLASNQPHNAGVEGSSPSPAISQVAGPHRVGGFLRPGRGRCATTSATTTPQNSRRTARREAGGAR